MIQDKFLSYLYGKKGSLLTSKLPEETKQIITNLLNDIANNYSILNQSYKSRVSLNGWKGKSGLKILRFPKIFKIEEFRKADPDSKPKKITTIVDLETFNKIIKILALIPKNKTIKTREFSEKFCNEFGMLEFFNEGKFDYSRLFGTRNVYIHQVYYPLKIAEFYGLIRYNKRGFITRLKDKLEIQSEFYKEGME